MRLEFTSEIGSDRLLLIFAGWGMDQRPFADLKLHGCDIAVAFDYAANKADTEMLNRYAEIMVVAWSFGVIAADCFIAENPELKVTLRVAVNGTLHPVHDRMGIPQSIFQATLDNLCDASLLKFQRRMCGGAKACAEWLANQPERSLESLRLELMDIAAMNARGCRWDKAYVGLADKIIPPDNQIAAWNSHGTPIATANWPHLPDFKQIIAESVVDKSLVASRFSQAIQSYESNATVQMEMATELSDLWQQACQDAALGHVVEIGAGSGAFTRAYTKWLAADTLELWDLAEIPESLPGSHRKCDGESAIRDCRADSLDAIVSAATVQWFSSPGAFLAQCMDKLRPGGWLVISTFGPENFRELNRPDYQSAREWENLISQNGLETVALSERQVTLTFDSPHSVLQHMKLTGVNAIAHGAKAVTSARRIIASGVCDLTYHPILIVARRPNRETPATQPL